MSQCKNSIEKAMLPRRRNLSWHLLLVKWKLIYSFNTQGQYLHDKGPLVLTHQVPLNFALQKLCITYCLTAQILHWRTPWAHHFSTPDFIYLIVFLPEFWLKFSKDVLLHQSSEWWRWMPLLSQAKPVGSRILAPGWSMQWHPPLTHCAWHAAGLARAVPFTQTYIDL